MQLEWFLIHIFVQSPSRERFRLQAPPQKIGGRGRRGGGAAGLWGPSIPNHPSWYPDGFVSPVGGYLLSLPYSCWESVRAYCGSIDILICFFFLSWSDIEWLIVLIVFSLPYTLAVFRNMSCSFERGFCQWRNVRNSRLDQFDWTLWNGSTPSRNTGPTNDHTLGTARGWWFRGNKYTQIVLRGYNL